MQSVPCAMQTDWILQICDAFAGWAGGTSFNALTSHGSAGLLELHQIAAYVRVFTGVGTLILPHAEID